MPQISKSECCVLCADLLQMKIQMKKLYITHLWLVYMVRQKAYY